jgi:hypothetical protein
MTQHSPAPPSATRWTAASLAATLLVATPIGSAGAVDTQFIFGFTMGADVGEVGEKEIEVQSFGRFGKADGSYTALEHQIRLEVSPVENLRLEIGVPLAIHSISGVSGLDDRQQAAFNGVAFEARYRLLNREDGPFGFTIGAEPHWARVDDASGEPVNAFGGELSLAADSELVANRVYAAVNLLYAPEWTSSRLTGLTQRQSTLGVSAAATVQAWPGIFLGGDARYLRAFDGIGFDALAGDALFIGPMLYARFSHDLAVSAAWNIQVTGRAVDSPGVLNLTTFERQRALLRVEYNF